MKSCPRESQVTSYSDSRGGSLRLSVEGGWETLLEQVSPVIHRESWGCRLHHRASIRQKQQKRKREIGQDKIMILFFNLCL